MNIPKLKVTANKKISTSNQSKFVLSTPIQEFNSKKFRMFFYSAKNLKELQRAKIYLCSYFACGKVCVYKWDPKNKIFEYYNKKDACDSFIQSDSLVFNNAKGEIIDKFNIQSWFFRETPFFSLEVNPYQSLIYRESNGAYYINKFPRFLHTNPIPFN